VIAEGHADVPRCSIVIPIHNRASLTRQCLNAVLRDPATASFETIVVDDGSTDDTTSMLAEFGGLIRIVRHPETRGFATASNSGASEARGEYLIFLNNDTVPEAGWIDALVAYADLRPNVAVVGSKLLYPDGTIQHAGIVVTVERIPRHIYLGFPGDHPATAKSRPFQAVTAAATLIRRDVFVAASGFDESFLNGYEDIDLCLRLRDEGYDVHYCHTSVLYHYEKATRGVEASSENHELFLKRWPHLMPDDLQYYVADGLLALTYSDHYPIKLEVSPLLAVISDEHEREADALLAVRARQVFDLLQETTRLRIGQSTPVSGESVEPNGRTVTAPPPRKAVLFISGSPGDAMRYRCDHQAEALGFLGVTADVARVPEVALDDVLERYEFFVLHRVAYGPDLEWFMQQARIRGKRVLFDTDDLVFDRLVTQHVPALEEMTELERTLYQEGLTRYRETLLRSDGVIVTTETLRALVGELHSSVLVVPNSVSSEMVRLAREAHDLDKASNHPVIGYFSGTKTHNKDFLEASDAVITALEENAEVEFLVVGLLALDDRFDRFADRITKVPIQAWRRLPELLAGVDVNLAPLEPANPFTDSKSCIKYLEAGLVAVPTIASPRSDFLRVIDHGENGVLAESPEEWRAAVRELTGSSERRRAIGEAARDDVLKHHTTLARAPEVVEAVRAFADATVDERPLTINWILHAPIAQTSGGYRTIFRLARHLQLNRHRVRMYISPVAHLSEFSDRQIHQFIEANFDATDLEILVNRAPADQPNFDRADVSIATFWPTATAVAADNQSLFKAYYVQDFEPTFYDERSELWEQARASYDLPLKHICIGESLATFLTERTGRAADHIDFALRPQFRLQTDLAERGNHISILFFARPHMPRRGYSVGREALARLKTELPDAEIRFFGCEDDELGDVSFPHRNLGVLDAEQLAKAMNSAHILLTFSLSNISHVPFEGMACGCAVVEADTPLNAGMLDDGDNCLLVTPDPKAVAAALKRLVTDDELRKKLGTRGAKQMEGRTWARTGDQFEAALLRLCFARSPVTVTQNHKDESVSALGGQISANG
jgi:GT2 family glycosyltransferase/glycosyltransferase involved in cell wall biosynthesis